jgi:hypothetical protein
VDPDGRVEFRIHARSKRRHSHNPSGRPDRKYGARRQPNLSYRPDENYRHAVILRIAQFEMAAKPGRLWLCGGLLCQNDNPHQVI